MTVFCFRNKRLKGRFFHIKNFKEDMKHVNHIHSQH